MAEVSNRAPLMRIESSQISPITSDGDDVGKERKQEPTKRKDSMELQEEEKASSPPNLSRATGCSGKCCIWSRKAPAQPTSTTTRSSEPKMSVTAQLELTGRDRIVVLETMPWINKVADNGGESTDLSGEGREEATSMLLHGSGSGVSTTLVHSSYTYTTNSLTDNIQSSLNTNFATANLPQAAVTAKKLGPPQHVQVILGLDVMPRIGMLVQLSHEGRASFDERLLCLSGCDDGSGQGHITKILSDLNGIEGKVCSVTLSRCT
jgi:hypothetical protein